ncbi:nucleotidyltransferase domain-containing protein [Candidatus Woesearchaeota archaeon]|nr:nucleotidyltransferase domain-containing protein [Candidatus Woesearchaeota archaeon]
MESKELILLNLFFNYPTKQWHFEDIVKESTVTRGKVDQWLKRFIENRLIIKIKEKGKMPYYIADYDSHFYKSRKKLFAYEQLYESGLLEHLYSLQKIKTIIIFGSFARTDWYKKSDIDLFVYGDPKELHIAEFELRLKRDIQLFICENKNDINKYDDGLLKNIIKGNLIKGDIDFINVKKDA